MPDKIDDTKKLYEKTRLYRWYALPHQVYAVKAIDKQGNFEGYYTALFTVKTEAEDFAKLTGGLVKKLKLKEV